MDELEALRADNTRLKALLEANGIDWRGQPVPMPSEPASDGLSNMLSTTRKVQLFRSLFRGREDVHPVRWESKTTGKSGYAPAFEQGRKVLVLTERADHLLALQEALQPAIPGLFVLHGRMSRNQRAATAAELDGLASDTPRVLLATGKLVGEGFDHPALDTLVLAMPVSWKGTLQQYAGRLHRAHSAKTDIRIVDFVDMGHPAPTRMWERRLRGYSAMGYRIGPELL